MNEARPWKKRWSVKRLSIILGRKEPPPDSATKGDRLEDLLGWIGIRGGKVGLLAAAILTAGQGLIKLADAIDRQAEATRAALEETKRHATLQVSAAERQTAAVEAVGQGQGLIVQRLDLVVQEQRLLRGQLEGPIFTAPRNPPARSSR